MFKTMKNVLLIGEDGEKLGNGITLDEAKRIARVRGLDLMLVNEDKQVYKLGDRGKLNYEKKQRDKKRKAQRKAQQRSQKIKEIQISPNTDKGDIDIKVRKIKGFLEDGLRTKLVMKFKRSQLGYKTLGLKKVNELVGLLVEEGVAVTDRPPTFDGNRISVFLTPPPPPGK